MDRGRGGQSASVGHFKANTVGVRVGARATHRSYPYLRADLGDDSFGVFVGVVEQRHLPFVGQIAAGYLGRWAVVAGPIEGIQRAVGGAGDAHGGCHAVQRDGQLFSVRQLIPIHYGQDNGKETFVGTNKNVFGISFFRGSTIAEVPVEA